MSPELSGLFGMPLSLYIDGYKRYASPTFRVSLLKGTCAVYIAAAWAVDEKLDERRGVQKPNALRYMKLNGVYPAGRTCA